MECLLILLAMGVAYVCMVVYQPKEAYGQTEELEIDPTDWSAS